MRGRGRPSVATAAERAEVERLLAGGVPIRSVAAQVFGDARYRGRVERIHRRRVGSGGGPSDDFAAASVEALASEPASLRAVLERQLARVEQPGVESSPRELRKLLKLWSRLLAVESVGRVKALTGSAPDICWSKEPRQTDEPLVKGEVAAGPDVSAIVGAALAAWFARVNSSEELPSLTDLGAALEVERRLVALATLGRAKGLPWRL
jgi:hypothetical protein